MKKMLLAITIAVFGAVALDRAPGHQPVAYGFTLSDEKKNDKKDKKPPGPPVVRDKQPKAPEPPPRKNKRPE